MPYKTEIAPILIVARLEEFAYGEATAIAVVLLVISFSMLVLINLLETLEQTPCTLRRPCCRSRRRRSAARRRIPAWVRWMLIALALARGRRAGRDPGGQRVRRGARRGRRRLLEEPGRRIRTRAHSILLTLTVVPDRAWPRTWCSASRRPGRSRASASRAGRC